MSARRPLVAAALVVLCACGGSNSTMKVEHGSPETIAALPAPTYSLAPRDQEAPSDRTLYFYYGPMKLMPGETILYSIAAFTGHRFGAWDPTAPDPAALAFADAGNAAGTFYRHCPLFGGCMEHRIPLGRTSFVGTAYVLEFERAIVEGCNDRAAFGMFPNNRAPDATTLAIDVIRHQYQAAFAEAPSDTDVLASMAYFSSHVAAPELTGMTALESAGRGHCRALLSTNRFLFY